MKISNIPAKFDDVRRKMTEIDAVVGSWSVKN